MIAKDLSKQQAPNADPKAIQQIDFRGNLERDGNENTTFFFYYQQSKRNCFRFFKSNCKSILILLFALI